MIAQIMLLLQKVEMGLQTEIYSSQRNVPLDKLAIAAARMTPLYRTVDDNTTIADMFSTTRGDWIRKFSATNARQGKTIAEFVDASKLHLEEDGKSATALQSRISRTAAALILRSYRQLRRREQELDQLSRTFLEHMRLAGPADYWEQKAQQHKRDRKNLRWIVGGVILATVAATAGFYIWIGDHVDPAHFGTIVLLSPAALVGLWGARLAFRAYNRNNDLLNDAEQRKVLAQTYLALTKEGAAIAAEGERLLILQALVRPEGAGEDDVSSGSLIELLKVATQKT
jgi:hypothetical protein